MREGGLAVLAGSPPCYFRHATLWGMRTPYAERIILIGPPGSGKTTVGLRVARLLGWMWMNTDGVIANAEGRDIAAIFAEDGEQRFRDLESATLRYALNHRQVVISTGGGVGERAGNLELMRESGWVVSLSVRPESALERMRRQLEESSDDPGAVRPLLAGDDPLRRIHELSERRMAWYAQADEVIATDDLDVETVGRRIIGGLAGRGLLDPEGAETFTRPVSTGSAQSYDAVVQWCGLVSLPQRLANLGLPPRLHIVADANVALLYEPSLMSNLLGAGFDPLVYRVPSGEGSKSQEQLSAIYDWLAERRAERREAVLALGGGVVGDLAGFAAATYLRGVPLVHISTSLLAQVDASIGGKVAINHPRGKNLIGAFYQPRLVLSDPSALLTMPPRERTEGWAEVVKHGVALDAVYFEQLERDAHDLPQVSPAVTTKIIAGSVALKASVVEGDEREQEGGRRHLLNYGHTIGHAIEAVAGYGAWLHGEAVAVGMMVAARIGERMGVTPGDLVERQGRLLRRFGLPVEAHGLVADELMRAALWDKKVSGGRVRWVLPNALGHASLHDDVPDDVVRAALLESGAE
ncbi:MAG TPA: 3-dehydroquinate synthase [Ktedonobacterales bacterium]